MKCRKSILVLLLAAAMLLVVLVGCGTGEEQEESIQINVTIIYGDGSEEKIELETAEETLGRALVEGGIVEDNQTTYGLYILTVNGVTANEANQEWWCITKDGESVMTGADETEILDGDAYEITLTVGY